MPFRYLQSPEGSPFTLPDDPQLVQRAGFGPGKRYWTHSGFAFIDDGQLLLVMPGADDQPERVVVTASVDRVTVKGKPWWSFGQGLHLEIDGEVYTLEPEPLVPGQAATPGRMKRAREAAKEFESALAAAKGQA